LTELKILSLNKTKEKRLNLSQVYTLMTATGQSPPTAHWSTRTEVLGDALVPSLQPKAHVYKSLARVVRQRGAAQPAEEKLCTPTAIRKQTLCINAKNI
jgi:hypothetical protein